MRTLRTARLSLVPVTSANASLLWQVLQAPDLRDYQDLPEVNHAQFLRMVAARPTRLAPRSVGRFEWLIHFAEGGEALGWVSLRIPEPNRSTAELGYSVVRAHRGHGIASEAVAALVEESFRRVKLQRLRAFCLVENHASRRVLARNGFEDEGVLERGATVAGRAVDVVLYCLQRQHWAGAITPNRAATRS